MADERSKDAGAGERKRRKQRGEDERKRKKGWEKAGVRK